MAMTSRAAPLAAVSLFALALAGGCRSTTVCDPKECPELPAPGGAGSGGQVTVGATNAGGMAAGEAGAEAGLAGELGMGGGGAPPDEPAPLTCEPNMADCDRSRLTGCESDVTWTVRHCGACGQRCDGLCLGGRCEPTVLVQEAYAETMVASATTGFAIVSDLSGPSLVMIDMETASSTVLISNVSRDSTLAASADRFYLLDRAQNELHSGRLDGSDFKNEMIEWPLSIGATAKGAYYVGVVSADETDEAANDTVQLHFRRTGSQAWQLLREGPEPLRILSSSAFGLVLATYPDEYAEDADAELSLWDGTEELALGKPPPGFVEAASLDGGYVAMLTYDEDSGVSELWWSKPNEEPLRYEVPNPSNSSTADLIVHNDSVLLYIQESGKAFLQLFDAKGPVIGRMGLLPAANLVWADAPHVWYGVYDTWVTVRFLRSTWFDLKF